MNYGGGEEPPGGKAINFQSSLSLQFRTGSWLYYDKNGNLSPDGSNKDTVTKDTEPDGFEYQVRTTKNTVSGNTSRTARWRVGKADGKVDSIWELIRFGIYFDVFEQAGSWYSYNGSKAQGENGLREWLINDEELRNKITQEILERA
jgi:hypothetical protein